MADGSARSSDCLSFAPLSFAPGDLAQFRRRLLRWFRRRARDLPWRDTSNPYHVWVSEIMLQQTQVATVIPYFHRFVRRFPTIHALAGSEQQAVLRLWEGLGYYRRARQMHEAARMVVHRHGGRLPRDIDALQRLPGIGRYTAGAILSIAFDEPAPILEANTIRLFSRLSAFRGDVSRTSGQRHLWRIAAGLIPARGAGAFNQALMELGSLVCTSRDPACGRCPVSRWCVAHGQGLQSRLPSPRKNVAFERIDEAAVVVYHRRRVLIRQQSETQRWAGLWDFPRFRITPATGTPLEDQLIAGVEQVAGIRVAPSHLLTTLRHGVTRYRITLHCHTARYVRRLSRPSGNGSQRWVSPEQLHAVPLHTTGRKICRLLLEGNGPTTDR